MIVEHTWCRALWHSLTNTVESLGTCHKEYLVGITSINGIANKSVLLYKHLALHSLQVEVVECLSCRWTTGERVGGYREQYMSAVGSDVAYRNGMIGICERLHHTRGKVKTGKRVSRAPPWLTVVGMHNLEHSVLLLRSFLRLHDNREGFCRRYGIVISRHIRSEHSLSTCGRVNSLQHFLATLLRHIVITVGGWHPRQLVAHHSLHSCLKVDEQILRA